MIFEGLPTTPTSEELIDKAFSRAARAGRAKHGLEAQQSMLQTAATILSDNLENVVSAWPDFEHDVDPFYYELADALVDVDALRQSLSRVGWASRKTRDIHSQYQSKLRKTDVDTARKHRKQAFARLADVVEQVETDLERIGAARNTLRDLPSIDPDEPTIVVAGYPNVGKSSFVNAVTRARGDIASYPFTTKGIGVGHVERDHVRYQIVDTPGLLDRPPAERNEIESQAVSALTHLADLVLVLLDPTGECGFPFEAQLELRDDIDDEFEAVPVLSVLNKADRFSDTDVSPATIEAERERTAAVESAFDFDSSADEVPVTMSVETGDTVDAVLDVAIDVIDYEPALPFER